MGHALMNKRRETTDVVDSYFFCGLIKRTSYIDNLFFISMGDTTYRTYRYAFINDRYPKVRLDAVSNVDEISAQSSDSFEDPSRVARYVDGISESKAAITRHD